MKRQTAKLGRGSVKLATPERREEAQPKRTRRRKAVAEKTAELTSRREMAWAKTKAAKESEGHRVNEAGRTKTRPNKQCRGEINVASFGKTSDTAVQNRSMRCPTTRKWEWKENGMPWREGAAEG